MWIVPKIGGQETRQDSKLDRFFDQQTKSVALVREAVQNSLDVQVNKNKPVRISFTFSETSASTLTRYLKGSGDESLVEHLAACGITANQKKVRVVVVEDFNTEGLTGETDNMKIDDEGQAASGNFIGFWWSEGLSDKKRGSGGSHGVGKIKLSSSSDYKCFFALTNRADDEKQFLIGYSQLKYHVHNGQQFRGYARFGKVGNEGGIQPYDVDLPEDKNLTERFRKDFGLKRQDETGLSVVIPAVNQDITEKSVLEAILSEFYVPLLTGSLAVDIHGPDDDLAVNAETIGGLTDKHLGSNAGEILAGARRMLGLHTGGHYYPQTVKSMKGDGKWKLEPSDFSELNLNGMQHDFTMGKMVGVRVPVVIDPADSKGKPIESWFDVFIQDSDGIKVNGYEGYVRDKLLIRKEKSGLGKPFSMAFVYITEENLSEFLKYAEDPGHERWAYNTLKATEKYSSDSTLRFIKGIVRDFYNILAGIDDDKTVQNVSPEIFSVKEPNLGPKKGGKTGEGPTKPITNRSRSPFAVTEKAGGFKLKESRFINDLLKSGEISFPLRGRIRVAYKKPLGNSLKNYSSFDFSLSDPDRFVSSLKNVDAYEADGNEIQFETSATKFSIDLKGFDENRDIEVQCQLL